MMKINVKASKSSEARSIPVEYDFGESLDEMADKFDHQAIFEATREMFIQQLRDDVRSKLNADETDDEIHEAVSVWKPLPVSVSRQMNSAINSFKRLSPEAKEKVKASLEQQMGSTK